MDKLKTVIFVDGENFRNNLRNFKFQSTPPHPTHPKYELEERHFLWSDFFAGIISKFDTLTTWEHRLARVYWYYAASISPWREIPGAAQRIVNRYSSSIPNLTVGDVNRLAREWYDRERRYFYKLREDVFPHIQGKTDFLEFKYVGQYVVRPFRVYKLESDPQQGITYLGYQQGEKGVDVGIAADMIEKMPHYDVAILVSGDADFLPAVKYLKEHLKQVYQFSLARGVPPRIEYLSPDLKGYVDCFAHYDEIDLLSRYLDSNCMPRIPQPIVQAIGDRISALRSA